MQSDKLKYLPAVITELELLPPDRVLHVAGRNWSSMNVRRMVCLEGRTVREILIEVLRRALGKEPTTFQTSVWLDRCRCKVDGVEIAAEKWAVFKPQAGSFVEFLVSPGKGGGGKNILSSVLMIAVVAAAFVTGQWYLGAYGATTSGFAMGSAAAAEAASIGITTSWTAGSLAMAATASMAVMTLGTYAVGKICPTVTSPQQAISSSAAKSSQTYSITGSQNAVNPFGYVPLVLGRYRFAGPLGAKSWTKQVGDDQYFNMLVVWGHPDMTVTDFRIGDTPLGEFKDVTHVFHGSTTGNDLQYFGKSYSENSVGATLKYNEPVTRVVGECDSISVDIYSPAMADVSSGHASSASASFKIEYAPVGTEDWLTYAESTKFFAPAQYVDCYTGASQNDAWATTDGTWHVRQSDSDWGIPDWTSGKIQASDPHWNPYPIERYKDKHKHHEWWFRDSWYDAGTSTTLTISAAQTTPLTRTYEWAVPHGEYQVRITRLTPESDRDTLYNDITWSVMRAVVNQPAFNTPIPICVSELCIRASEQLSGYVDNFNALCCSRLPVYSEETGGWTKDSDGEDVVDETQNPADHLRYLLTSRHALNSPYSLAKVDETSLAAFAAYCKTKDYHFDFVCDTEASAWTRWTAAASAGRGAVTTDNDGLFGVTVDNAEKAPVQMFTPRNSWGFSIERSYYTMPHALRVSFYDETEDYEEKEGFIYADGYDKTTATDIVEWNFTGKTRWEDLYKMGRYYLASMRLRPITVTLSTDWEWMMCRRGDVVGVAHDVLMNTFGTARVVSLIYRNAEGNLVYVNREEDKPADGRLPVGVRLDDSVHFSEEAAYGIAIRQSTGKLHTYQIVHALNDITEDMMFANAITEAQVPYIGALASVSTLGSEYAEYLVASITVNSDNSAELTLVPWAMPEILDAESGAVPAWEPVIKLSTIGNKNKLPAPAIHEIRSDESVLVRSGDAILSQIAVWWTLPSGIPAEFKRLYVQLRVKDAEGNVFSNSVDVTTADYVAVQGVEDGREYTVYLRLVTDTGVTSDWTGGVTETVVGKTSLPPTPEGFTAVPQNPEGIRVSWQAVTVADLDHYEISGSAETKTIDTSVILPIYGRTGSIPFELVSVDTLGLKSSPAAEAAATVDAPALPSPTYEVLTTEGARIRWQDCKTTWSIDHYVVEDMYAGETMNYADTQFSISPRPIGNLYEFHIQAVDIFQNVGPVKDFSVSIGDIEAPKPSVSVDGTQLVISWGVVLSPFQIDVYEVADDTGKVLGKVKGTTFRFLAPAAGIWNFRVRAVDIIGQASAWGECSITLTDPKAPQVSAVLEGDHIALTWSQPALDGSQVPVIAYDVVRQWEVERDDGLVETMEQDYGRTDALALSVPAVKAGEHSFMVRAVDNSRNVGPWGYADFVAYAPGRVTFFNCAAVDNNVMLYFTTPSTEFFPIRDYLVEEIEGDYAAEIGHTDSQFFADIKSQAGAYTYGVTPVDIAGNLGQRSSITIMVSQPPDFIMYADYHSLFNGAKTDMVLDGEGHMIGPVPQDETWQENALRSLEQIGSLAGSYGKALIRDYGGKTWLRLYYLDCGEDGNNPFPESKEQAWDCSIGETYFSKLGTLRDNDALFRQPDGTLEFLAFQSDETGPMSGDSSIYAQWTQTENPCTTPGENTGERTDPLPGFTSIAKVGTSYPYGLALSTSSSTLMDGQPYHSNWFGAVGQLTYYNGTTPYLTSQRYAQLWIRIDGTEIGDKLSSISWKDKTDAGMEYFFSPPLQSGVYSEIVDVGTIIPSTKISVTVTEDSLSETPAMRCKIEVSKDKSEWRTMTEDGTTVYATSFRYVRYTLTWTSGLVSVSDIYYRLDVKRKMDFGQVTVAADDNGEGWVSMDKTPLLTGKWVPFTVAFTDVQSFPQPQVVNDTGKTAHIVFEDKLNPEGFRIFALDKDGNRVAATIDWAAYGV